ncbi:MFS transporter [Streptomyces sp. SID3343]|uniref:MFS transporter n=1 Tax=Streptomyces sp. SID3343 TaxID=2690260 RepID=UPI001F21F0FF|nr:MFS transporter [Streptomyces sp. SID3343]
MKSAQQAPSATVPPDSPDRPTATPPAGVSRTGFVLLVLIMGALTYSLLQSMLAPALPQIQKEIGATADSTAWLMTGYLLCASVTTPILGRLGDMYGKKRLFVFTIAMLAVGSLVCALADSVGLMIIGRIVQGFGGAVFPLSFGIVRDEFPPEKRAGAIGLMSAIMGIGGGIGIVVTGPIMDHLSYHWLFWIPMVVCAITAAGSWFLIPESPVRVKTKIHWLGGLLLSLGLVGILLALSKGEAWGWGSANTLGLFALGLVSLALWVFAESRAAEPLVDMRVMRMRGVWATNLGGLLVGFSMMAGMLLVPRFLQMPESTGYGFGTSVTVSGLYVLPQAFAMLLIGPMAGVIDKRFGSKLAMVAGCVLMAAGFAFLAFAHTRGWHILVAMFVFGIGIGLAMSAMANLIVGSVPIEQTGIATGINTIARTVGMSCASAISTTLLTANPGADGLPAERGFVLTFVFAAAAALVALGVTFVVPSRPKPGAHPVR